MLLKFGALWSERIYNRTGRSWHNIGGQLNTIYIKWNQDARFFHIPPRPTLSLTVPLIPGEKKTLDGDEEQTSAPQEQAQIEAASQVTMYTFVPEQS